MHAPASVLTSTSAQKDGLAGVTRYLSSFPVWPSADSVLVSPALITSWASDEPWRFPSNPPPLSPSLQLLGLHLIPRTLLKSTPQKPLGWDLEGKGLQHPIWGRLGIRLHLWGVGEGNHTIHEAGLETQHGRQPNVARLL